ncbi:hypothetical protein JCM16106_06130 [Hydrogenophilus islandicus]
MSPSLQDWLQLQEPFTLLTALAATVGLLVVVSVLLRRVRRQARAIREADIERHAILEALGDGVIVQDAAADRILYINPTGAQMLGYTPEELIGQLSHATLHYAHPDGSPYPHEACPIWQTAQDGRARRVDDAFWSRHGEAIPVELSVTPIRNDHGRITALAVAFHDLRERQRLLAEIAHTAHYDALTGLLNRHGWERALPREQARLQRNGTTAAVALIDLDHFKQINDRYGHDVGDQVLSALGALLTQNLRPTDLIARWGGEEILVLFPETDLDSALAVLERLRNQWQRQRWETPEGPLEGVTFSAGVALWNGETPFADVLRAADQALYHAKRSGRNRIETALLPTPLAPPPARAPQGHR